MREHTALSMYWKKKWDKILESYPISTVNQPLNKQIELWSNIANTCGVPLGMNSERITEVMDIIKTLGLIDSDSTVLDIGCGTGAYAIPLSEIAKEVDALDFSAAMLEILQGQISERGISNIRLLEQDFVCFASDAKTKEKRYQLVFSSLNPGLYNSDSILEMTKLCCGSCIFISSKEANTRSEQCLDPIILEAESSIIKGGNVIYPFNMLYHMGYNPQIYYTTYYSDREESAEVAAKRLIKCYQDKVRCRPGFEQIISKYVEDNTTDGVFIEKTFGTLGVLIWAV